MKTELNELVQARVSATLKKKLRIYAYKYNMSESDVVRKILSNFLHNVSTNVDNRNHIQM